MKITAITVQKRRKDRYSIYLNGKYAVSLSESELLDAGLRVGDEVDESALKKLEDQSDFGKALDRTYNFLSYRDRSRKEIVTYLRGKQYEDEQIDQIVDRLTTQGFIDDDRFARNWTRNRQEFDNKSLRQVKAELIQKGIDATTIEIIFSSDEIESEHAIVARYIETKNLRRRYPDNQKLIQHLAGKGFRIDIIKAALEAA